MTNTEQGTYEGSAKGLVNSERRGSKKGVIERMTNKLCPGEWIGSFHTEQEKKWILSGRVA